MKSLKQLLKQSRGAGRRHWVGAVALAALSAPLAHAADAGMTVTKDPLTGQLRAPTAEEADALRAKPAESSARRSAVRAAPAEVRVHADGKRSLMLDESQMSYSVVTRNADGSLSEDCVVGEQAANAVVHAKPVPQAKRVAAPTKEQKYEVR